MDPKASDPADEALAARRAELERLGFEVDEGPPGELRAVHAKWIQPGEPAWLARRFTVVVRRLERLTLERLGADRATLVQPGSDVHPLAVVVCYLADEVDPGAQAAIEAGFGNVAFFPASLNLATCEGSYLRSTKIFGAALYPSLRYLARRLLFPQLAPEATLEPLAGPKIAAFFATVLMLFGAFVLQLIAG